MSDKFRWPALVLLLALPLIIEWQWMRPRAEALIGLGQRVEQLRIAARSTADSVQASSPERQLAEVMARLGPPEQLPERLERMHNLLRDYGVVLAKAAYKRVPGKDGGPGRYEIQLEVDGPYYGVRLFSRALLAQDASIALESLDLHREMGGGARIRAAMRWVMFFGGAAQ